MKCFMVIGFLVAAIIIVNGSPSSSSSLSRIIDGQDAVRNQIPSIVSIQEKTLLVLWGHICNGIIIRNNYILTAAQCIHGKNTKNLRIIAGILLLNDDNINNQQTIGVSQIITHESYSNSLTRATYDIGLLKLSTSLTEGDNVKPIVIASSPSIGTATVSGWGQTSPLLDLASTKLQYADVNVIHTTDCKSELDKLITINNPFDVQINICTKPISNGNQAPCGSHDLGAPLVKSNSLIGFYTWSVACSSSTAPTVYTNVPAFRKWITSHAI